MKLIVIAFLVIAVMLVIVSAIPADESILSDNVDNFHPADEAGIKKKLLLKKILLLKKKKLIG
ncbi:CLUMA_CG001398, isoform A [Clunio marinus]|uniref:CLUMA_CG001398, isoform A n=1 Tax=Clunio marinus TaxID=568069 RepID=A0A1J1HJ66_9DIPT|nr:CLUMA_CG001398, isoform A [Clunio marinus]